MSQNIQRHAALGIACVALALSIYTALRNDTRAAGPNACVDQQARDQTERLRRALADRDATMARLARAASAPVGTPGAPAAPAAPEPSRPSSPAAARAPRHYTHFEVPNPAVTVTQKDDGTYDIRTTDPKLSGTSLKITAVTQTGDEDTLFIRIP